MNRLEFIRNSGLAVLGTSFLAKNRVLAANIGSFNSEEEKAWYSLLEDKHKNNLSFKYVKNNPELKNVFIYGDSISIDYTPYVRKELSSIANVYRLLCNGNDSKSFIPNMDKLMEAMKPYWNFKFDAIHFNVGLHDLKYLYNGKYDVVNGTVNNDIPEYINELKSIIAWLKRNQPQAKIIFATTTPVPDNSRGRIKGHSVKYNNAALSVLNEYSEVTINDLYTYVLPNHETWMLRSGNVHYNEVGKKHQAVKVAAEILKSLVAV